jgi:flagellar biosynthesis protein FlhF
MNVRKFIAANARDALRKVKETLGNDAIILSNRGIPGGVEIMAVAARDMAMIVPTPVADRAPPERRPAPVDADRRLPRRLNSARAGVFHSRRRSRSAMQPLAAARRSSARPQWQP